MKNQYLIGLSKLRYIKINISLSFVRLGGMFSGNLNEDELTVAGAGLFFHFEFFHDSEIQLHWHQDEGKGKKSFFIVVILTISFLLRKLLQGWENTRAKAEKSMGKHQKARREFIKSSLFVVVMPCVSLSCV